MLCKLTYALDAEGRVVHISQAERGLGCGCFCPGCGEALIARRGDETEHHFAHASGEDCPNGYVNSLYCAFRRAVEELGRIRLPAYEKNRCLVENGGGLHVLIPETRVRIDRIDFTRKAGGRIAGLLLYKGDRPLIIRLLTSYSKGLRDLSRIKQAGVSVLEIDLTRDDVLDCERARAYFTDPPANVSWLYNAKAEGVWETMTALCAHQSVRKENDSLFTFGCPIPSRRKDGVRCFVMEGCARCQFFYGMYGVGEERYALCGGDKLVAEPEDVSLTMAQRRAKYPGCR